MSLGLSASLLSLRLTGGGESFGFLAGAGSSAAFVAVSMSFLDGRFFWRRAGGVWLEGEVSTGCFLLFLLGGRFEVLLDGFEGSSVCLEDDLELVSKPL